jgi:hypothetical protein
MAATPRLGLGGGSGESESTRWILPVQPIVGAAPVGARTGTRPTFFFVALHTIVFIRVLMLKHAGLAPMTTICLLVSLAIHRLE